jgi:hypothetical protein
MIVPLLLTFAFLPDNTSLPASFQMAGYTFNAQSATPALVINESAGEKGLQFPDQGLLVSLPAEVPVVDVRACAYAGAAKVEALAAAGFVADFANIPNNSCIDAKLRGRGIEEIRLTGGGHEGLLVSILCAVGVESEH